MANDTAQETQNAQGADLRGNRRTLHGVVTSNKMEKTVVVQVSRRVKAPKFGKYVTKRSKYQAHTESSDLNIGDQVLIVESRPISKNKTWELVREEA